MASASIVIVALLTELFPVFFGTGDTARLDWSAAYVTLHFVVLPLACLVGLIAGVTLLIRNISGGRPSVMRPAIALTAVSGLYLLALYLNPLPWFGR